MTRSHLYLRMLDALRNALGPANWWPAKSPFEVAVGAILTQNTSWHNVTKAIEALREADVLSEKKLGKLSQHQLEELVRPAGYYRQKARRLLNLTSFLEQNADGLLENLANWDKDLLRIALLEVNGIGPETADSILCYALKKPVLVVDTYTARIFGRHGLIPEDIDYHTLQSEIMDALPQDVALFSEYHAFLVQVGNRWCKRKAGQCEQCPLEPFLDS